MPDLRALVAEHTRGLTASHVWDEGRFVLASFVSSQRALDTASAIREAWQRRPATRKQPDLELRIGVHAGEPDGPDDVHLEEAASVARAVASQSSRGRILVTNLVRELSAGKSYTFALAGQIVAPAVNEPLSLYEI
jgi:class 3 adenylate cyclase